MGKLKVVSYTQTSRDKVYHEDIITDEYWTEHKNIDGSVLKVRVSSFEEGQKEYEKQQEIAQRVDDQQAILED